MVKKLAWSSADNTPSPHPVTVGCDRNVTLYVDAYF